MRLANLLAPLPWAMCPLCQAAHQASAFFTLICVLPFLQGAITDTEKGLNENANWSELNTRAQTFGQSDKEQQEVVSILGRVNEIMADRLHLNASYNASYVDEPSLISELQRRRLSPSNHGAAGVRRRPGKLKTARKLRQRLRYYKDKMDKVSSVPGRFADEDDEDAGAPIAKEEYFQGDIVLWKEQARNVLHDVEHEADKRKKRKFIRSQVRHWNPRQAIEYSFDGSHSPEEQKIISLALEHWENITCLNFVRKDTPPVGNRIVFTDVDGCASNVGRHPLGEPQFVSIGVECLRLGVIAHEVAHALGFWHEQSRPDRDDYVSVLWNNIDYGQAGQFSKETNDDVDNAGIPYDYGSIMHYRSKAFARNDYLYTIETNVGDFQRTIGQRDQLSFYDIKLMNVIYCSDVCPQKLPCQRGGYTDPRRCDRCRCPDGFTGVLCDQVMEGFGSPCGGVVELDSASTESFISSPNYPNYFKEGQECSWLLKAPQGMFVQLRFVSTFDMYCKTQHSLCMDYIEIRNTTDFANTGMRFCCYTAPDETIGSVTPELLVLFRSFYRSGRGFRASIRAVSATGSWQPWGPWSECSQSCGGCGVRSRQRLCASSNMCRGNPVETESCNAVPCTLCSQPQRVVVPCGLWGLFRCEKLSATYVPCNATNQCCENYVLNGQTCVPR